MGILWYFLLGFAIDVIGTYYACSVSKGQAQPAGVASALLFVSGVVINRHLAVSFESLPLFEIGATGFGYYVGTVVTVYWFNFTPKKENKKANG